MPTAVAKRYYSYQVWTFNAAKEQAKQSKLLDIESVLIESDKAVIERINEEIDKESDQKLFEERLFWIFHLKHPIINKQIEVIDQNEQIIKRRGFWIFFDTKDWQWAIFDHMKDVIKEIRKGEIYLSVDDETLDKIWSRMFLELAIDLFEWDDIATWN